MGDSNSDWGALPDDPTRNAWDDYQALPVAGENAVLDAFVTGKHLTIEDLVRTGARLHGSELVWAYSGGLKYRDMITGDRRNSWGAVFDKMKRVPAQRGSAFVAIVAEGETDGARLSALYPEADTYILPAGAQDSRQSGGFADQLRDYDLVLLAHDPDDAGEAGAEMFKQALPRTLRWLAPNGDDWAAVDAGTEVEAMPDPDSIVTPVEQRLIVSVGELLELAVPEVVSWFDAAILPIGGSMIVHGWTKSFKSFIVLDILASIAQGRPWAGFEPTNEPGVGVLMQYEIPWAFFYARIAQLRDEAIARGNFELFSANARVWTPLSRPRYRAGDKVAEDAIRRELEAASAQVFILDPVRRAIGSADMNSEQEVRPLLNFIAQLQDDGITVIVVHHDRKTDRGSGDSASMTGSGAFAGDFDSIVSVAIPKGLTERDPQRDLHFLLRNAQSPAARSMEMTESGLILYHDRPVVMVSDEPEKDDRDLPGI